jgi:glucose/arabinose dehydrogenase
MAAPPGRAAAAPVLPTYFVDSLVVGSLTLPTGMAFLPDGRLLVTERLGAIRLVVNGGFGTADPMAVLDSVAYVFFESGLLGIAVDPKWPLRPYVYLYYTAVDHTIRISRFKLFGALEDPTNPGLFIDPTSRYELIHGIPDDQYSHNGGTIRFGPDEQLYVALADDWNECAAQDTISLRGVLLRLDVSVLPDGPGGPPDPAILAPADNPFVSHPHPHARLVWAMGLRNPFRFHIDPATGGVFIADVGLSLAEEIDLVDGPGLNLGWPYWEANWPAAPPCAPDSVAQFTPPIYSYDRLEDPLAAVIGAGVYRCAGCWAAYPSEYEGSYFFSDFYMGFLRRIQKVDGVWGLAPPVPGQPSPTNWAEGFEEVTDYLVGPDGSIWYIDHDPLQEPVSEIRRIFYRGSTLSVPEGRARFALAPPRPSPARGPVSLSFSLSAAGYVDLGIFDVSGRRVRAIVAPSGLAAGQHVRSWDLTAESGERVAPGLYVAVLAVDGVRRAQRVVVLR